MRTRLPIAVAMLSVLAALSYWAYDASQLYVFREEVTGSFKYDLLFDTAVTAIPVAALIGIFLGTLSGRKVQTRVINGKVERHDELMFIQHWTNAIGTVLLIVTGVLLGTLFIPRMLVSTEHVGFALNLHFVGILFFFFGISYYVTKGMVSGDLKHMMPRKGDLKGMIGHYRAMFFGGTAPKEEKFLAAERVVFPFWIIGVGGIALTGIVKTIAHIWSMPGGLMEVTTFLHGVFGIYMALMLVAHIIAGSLLPASWPLFRSMITGNVTEKYVKAHHEKWYEELQKTKSTDDDAQDELTAKAK